MENETTSLWSKKQDEVTVAESLQVAVAVAAVMALTPIVIRSAASAVNHVYSKFRGRQVTTTTTPEEK